MLARGLLALLVLVMASWGCGSVGSNGADARPPGPDATMPPGGDGGPAGARTARELVSGGGRVSGGGLIMDVQIGHPVQQKPATGGSMSVEGAAAIKP